ncbi:hypothetical protein [Agrobacterium sp. LAD9]|uniref:transposase-like zinc-binding domain-containing protein n=1 Tax=Agrobacterium sp. LAD9 TaxID=2055153 RepID=UPI00128FED3A|nr:hypothetical protein [Agrobacterium sp. LAD9]
MDCRHCHSDDLRKAGFKSGAQRYFCRACGCFALDPQGTCRRPGSPCRGRAGGPGRARCSRNGRNLYIRSKKAQRAVVWTAFSRRLGRVIAYHIGDKGTHSAMALYRLARQAVGRIDRIYTDANSCYRLAFERNGVPEPHVETKAQTHLIEASNSSIREQSGPLQSQIKTLLKDPAHARSYPRPLLQQTSHQESKVNTAQRSWGTGCVSLCVALPR